MSTIKSGIVILLLFVTSASMYSQDIVTEITDKYFPINPLNTSFSDFLKSLLKDSSGSEKSINKRTDSTLFFFKANYQDRNPFSFTSKRTEIRFAEIEESKYEGSIEKDTVFFYQCSGYTNNNNERFSKVKAELNSFFRDYRSQFARITEKEIEDNGINIGEIYNFIPRFSMKPAIIASWMKLNENESIFTVTIRLHVKENKATAIQKLPDNFMPARQEDLNFEYPFNEE